MTRRPHPVPDGGRRRRQGAASPARHNVGASATGVVTPGTGAATTERDAAGLGARRVALDILVRVDRGGAFADVLLGHRLAAMPPRERRLVTRLVLGTLAWRGRLDYELTPLCTMPLEKLDPAVLGALRLGLFQMRHLSRIPAHAAVDTAVSLAGEAAGRGAAGFVNAVLRRTARFASPMPERAADEAAYLAVACSHPRWMVELFIRRFGVERAEAMMSADNEAAPNTVRVNLARGTRGEIIARMKADGIEIASEGHLTETIILANAPDLNSESYRAGLFVPQSEASQLVARMLAPAVGADVVDCAAAPGGKATHLAELVGPRGRVVAFDFNLRGLIAARALARRLGHINIDFARADIGAPPLRTGGARFVLLDAPCTGTGTLREHPEIRWRLKESDLSRMAGVQRRMLESVAALVAPGGVLVYAVCSLAPEEGLEVARDFLGRHPEFSIERPPVPQLGPLLDSDGALVTSPERSGLAGFFAARMRRR